MAAVRALVVMGIIFAIAIAAWLSWPAANEKTTSQMPLKKVQTAQAEAQSLDAKLATVSSSSAASRSTAGAMYGEFSSSVDYRVTLAQLLAKNTPETIYLATLVPSRCGLFLPKPVAVFRASIEKANSPLTEKPRLAALERLQRPCATLSASDIDAIAEKRFEMIKSSAMQGDLRARSEMAGLSLEGTTELRSESIGALPAALQTKDPIVADNIASIYATKFGDRSFSLPGVEGNVNGVDLSAALRLLACDFGKDCSQYTPELAMACLRQARCDATSLYDYIQRYELTPDRAGRLLNIQKMFQNGLATGSWPSGLWPQAF